MDFTANSLPVDDPRWSLVRDQGGKIHVFDKNPVELENEPQPLYDPMTDIVYHLFTRRNPIESQILDTFDLNTVLNSNWIASNDVRILVHGFTGDMHSPENPMFVRDLLTFADHNVIGKFRDFERI